MGVNHGQCTRLLRNVYFPAPEGLGTGFEELEDVGLLKIRKLGRADDFCIVLPYLSFLYILIPFF